MLSQNKKLALLSIFSAITVILGYLENFIPLPLPGVKLGLSNIGVMLSIYTLGFSYSLAIVTLKSLIVPIFTGNFIVKIALGLPASLISFLIMYVYFFLTKNYSTPLSTGALGAYFHILIQFFVAKQLFIKNLAIFKIFPYFSLLSVLTGILTGIITYKILKILNNY
ncbi:Gx transporter family protein [Deferribacter autotrophicus]|uniref:Gx transporter family protein n=1 Tax=Deferribacter autotrophicus TaxID=500465 RepID=A0A5A8EYZ2_9BACT|nr:Gx transporter family protein [Deferribacter autotrophicus]KAA0256881.1 Gx transporter family protein [Deferribacter autotrophicus]